MASLNIALASSKNLPKDLLWADRLIAKNATFIPPHSPEWFRALDAFQPAQAAHTRQF